MSERVGLGPHLDLYYCQSSPASLACSPPSSHSSVPSYPLGQDRETREEADTPLRSFPRSQRPASAAIRSHAASSIRQVRRPLSFSRSRSLALSSPARSLSLCGGSSGRAVCSLARLARRGWLAGGLPSTAKAAALEHAASQANPSVAQSSTHPTVEERRGPGVRACVRASELDRPSERVNGRRGRDGWLAGRPLLALLACLACSGERLA